MRRFCCLVLFAIVALCAAFSSTAATVTIDGITWTYTVSNGAASLGGGSSSSTAVPTSTTGTLTIPSKLSVRGYPVTSIGSDAFRNCRGLTSVTIPDSVTSIGSSAFRNCSGLTSVTIPDSVESIGSYAFYGCSGLMSVHITDIANWCGISFGNLYGNPLLYAKNLFFNGLVIENLTIPDGVTSIGRNAFRGCSGLTSVTIPNSVTSIGDSAFSGCSGLTSVTMPNSVTSIGFHAFQNCSGLTSATIGNGVTNIAYQAFYGCTALADVKCYPDAAGLAWGYARYDVKADGSTVIHVKASQLAAYQEKFSNVKATFVGDLPDTITVTIGSGDTMDDSLPTTSFYSYSISHQIYTSEEIGTAGTISSIAFKNGGIEKTRTLDIYLAHTDKSSFDGTSDWIPVSETDKVFSGSVTFIYGGWTEIPLDTPFDYNGMGNLAVIVDDNTMEYSTGLSCYAFAAPGMALSAYSDDPDFNPLSPGGCSVMDVKSQIQLVIAKGDAAAAAVAEFADGDVYVSESETMSIVVNGGSESRPTSVKLCLSYLNAAAADIDLKNATVDGETPKGGLKFPLTLAWDTGDTEPKTIAIPVKPDKAVEDDEMLLFQLADAVGMEMGETDICTVTVKDPAFGELRNKIKDGTATKGESNNWIKVSHDGIPYFCGVAMPGDGGKATGSGYCPVGKKVTLKASANKGFAFAGWTTNEDRSASAPYPEGYFVATTPSLVIDRTTKPAKDTKTSTTISNLTESTTFYAVFEGDPRVSATPVEFTEDGGVVATDGGKVTGAGRYEPGKKVTLKATANKGFVFGGWYVIGNREEGTGNSDEDGLISQQASFSFEMGEEDVDLYARFVTTVEDEASIRLVLNGTEMSANPAAVPSATNYCGVAVDWQVAASALSATTVKAAGLPAGVKLVQDKETGVWSLLGAPTAASKAGKDGNLVPSRVKLTVTTAGKSSATYAFDWTILPLPAWTVGLFEGFAATTTTPEEFGPASMSATAAGKVSGKFSILGTNWTFKADSYVDNGIGGPGIDEDGVHFVYVDATATAGKAVRKMIIMVIPFGLDLCPDSAISYCHGIVLKEGVDSMQSESDAEWQLLMYRIPWADKGDTVAASVVASYAGAYSCTAQYGTETCPVTFTLDEKGVIKGTVEVTDGNKARKVSFSTHALPYYDPDGLSAFIVIPADLKKGYPEIFAYCELVNHYGKPKAEKAYRNPGVIASSAAYDDPAAAGTVSVSPKYGQVAAGKEVTLTAKAASGSVFSHWEIAGADIDGLDLASPKLKVVAPGDADVSATAVFVTVAEDAGYIRLFVDSAELPPSPAEEVPKLSAEQGSPVSWPVETWTHSAATVKASGLPKGLKLVQDKTTKEYSVAGTPTAPSKKDAGGEYVPSVAKFTVTTAGKSSETFELAIIVVPTVE